jgi:lauroyl/myristoyl acyltransferase
MFCVIHIYKLLILGTINRKCLEKYKPHQNTSVDEAMIAFRKKESRLLLDKSKWTNYTVQRLGMLFYMSL